MTIVRIPGPLRPLAQGHAQLDITADTVGDALTQLVRTHPSLKRHLYDDQGKLRGFVNVFLNEEDVRHLDGERTRLGQDDVLEIVPSVAGGIALP